MFRFPVTFIVCLAVIVAITFCTATPTAAQPLKYVQTEMEGREYGSLEWGDFDNDGDLDLLATGCVSRCVVGDLSLYRNHNGSFVEVPLDISRHVSSGDARWADYDNDGDLDFAVSGATAGQGRRTSLVRNDFGNFVLDTSSDLNGLSNSALDWGDYDNDGDLDLLVIGENDEIDSVLEIYRNTSGVFQLSLSASLGVKDGTADWVDYNGDGLLDIFVTGINGQDVRSMLFSHDGLSPNPGFTFVETSIVANVRLSSTDWGDYDNDGDLDLILTGCQGFSFCGDETSYIYHNDNGTLVNLNANLRGVSQGSSNWIDYDSDGDLDLLVSGGLATILYANTNGNFTEVNEGIGAVLYSASAWAEEGPIVTLSWSGSGDSTTPPVALTYNLGIGTGPGKVDIMSPESFATRSSYLSKRGNTGPHTYYSLVGLPPGKYYWSVQAIDHGFQGSAYSSEEVFTIGPDQVVSNEDPSLLPATTRLDTNYPNPFSNETTITVELSTPQSIQLNVFNLQGQRIRQLHDGPLSAGKHTFTFSRRSLPSGVYYYQLQEAVKMHTRAMTVVN